MMIIANVGMLRELIRDLPDNMPVEGMDEEQPVFFVADYEDVPEGQRPPPTLVIEL